MNSTNSGGSNSISKTIAQAKLRKQRASRGASNPMHQLDPNDMSLSGTADYSTSVGGSNQFN